jgi:hypothetical protein
MNITLLNPNSNGGFAVPSPKEERVRVRFLGNILRDEKLQ